MMKNFPEKTAKRVDSRKGRCEQSYPGMREQEWQGAGVQKWGSFDTVYGILGTSLSTTLIHFNLYNSLFAKL